VLVERSAWAAFLVTDGGVAHLADVIARDIQPSPMSSNFGRALEVVTGSSATVARAAFESARHDAVLVVGSSVELSDVVVRGTRERASDLQFGRGLTVGALGDVRAERSVFEDNRDNGVIAEEGPSTAVLDGVVVRATREAGASFGAGRGVSVQRGATLALRRALVHDNTEAGVSALETSTSLELEDAIVADTRAGARTGELGRGVDTDLGAALAATRVLVSGNHEGGVAFGERATGMVADLAVLDTESEPGSTTFGRGLTLQGGADVTADRARLERNREAAVLISDDGTRLVARDFTIIDTRARESDGALGHGLHAQLGATLSVERAVVERAREVAVVSGGAGTSMVLSHLVVRDTLERECAATTCAELPAGVAVGVYDGLVDVTHFLLTGSALAGAQLARNGALDLHHGAVTHNVVGVNVQIPGYDLSRLMDDVRYEDNGVALDTSDLPVPDTALLEE
jgi:hypothetical protein